MIEHEVLVRKETGYRFGVRVRRQTGDASEVKEKPSRVLYFYGERGVIVLTHGFSKRGNGTPRTEIDHAVRLRALYQQQRGL
jgi:phage-related protein